jgi:hypothetical protein
MIHPSHPRFGPAAPHPATDDQPARRSNENPTSGLRDARGTALTIGSSVLAWRLGTLVDLIDAQLDEHPPGHVIHVPARVIVAFPDGTETDFPITETAESLACEQVLAADTLEARESFASPAAADAPLEWRSALDEAQP